MNQNDTMTINGEEWVRRSAIPAAKYPAQNTDGRIVLALERIADALEAGWRVEVNQRKENEK